MFSYLYFEIDSHWDTDLGVLLLEISSLLSVGINSIIFLYLNYNQYKM